MGTTASRKRFSFTGGHLALDFVNTLDWRCCAESREHLCAFADFVRWSRQAGLVDARRAAALQTAAERSPARAQAVLRQAVAVREATYRLCRALMLGKRPASRDVATIDRGFRRAGRGAALRWSGNKLAWSAPRDPEDLESLLEAPVRAAVELLSSDRAARIAQCQDDRGCGWVFLDNSRSGQRQWCSMSDCGNRAKALRHYRRAARRQQRSRGSAQAGTAHSS